MAWYIKLAMKQLRQHAGGTLDKARLRAELTATLQPYLDKTDRTAETVELDVALLFLHNLSECLKQERNPLEDIKAYRALFVPAFIVACKTKSTHRPRFSNQDFCEVSFPFDEERAGAQVRSEQTLSDNYDSASIAAQVEEKCAEGTKPLTSELLDSWEDALLIALLTTPQTLQEYDVHLLQLAFKAVTEALFALGDEAEQSASLHECQTQLSDALPRLSADRIRETFQPLIDELTNIKTPKFDQFFEHATQPEATTTYQKTFDKLHELLANLSTRRIRPHKLEAIIDTTDAVSKRLIPSLNTTETADDSASASATAPAPEPTTAYRP